MLIIENCFVFINVYYSRSCEIEEELFKHTLFCLTSFQIIYHLGKAWSGKNVYIILNLCLEFLCGQEMYKIVYKFLFPILEYIFSGTFVEMIKEIIVAIKQYFDVLLYHIGNYIRMCLNCERI